jgi:hypothetical protein
MANRRTLVIQDGVGITTGGSADFGQYHVAGYSRLTGLASTVGSLTLRISTVKRSLMRGVVNSSASISNGIGWFIRDFKMGSLQPGDFFFSVT